MPGSRITVLACVGLLALAVPVLAGEPGPRLCIEYLPSILYEDQPLAVCARVEAERAEAMRLAVSVRGAGGEVLASSGAAGTPRPGAPWRCDCSLRIPRGSPTALDVVLTKANGAVELGKATVRVLASRDGLPPLWAKGMRLADEAGQRVVVRIEHRVYRPEERWPLFRWVAHKLYGDRLAFDRVLLLGDDLGAPRDGYLAKFAAAKTRFKPSVLAVPSRVEPPTPPILRAVAALSRAAADDKPPDLAVLCLGHRDPDFGTDVLQFERGLELIAQELERRGCRHLVIASPVGPSHLRERLGPYTEGAQRVATTYRARFLDVGRHLTDEHWAGEAKDDRLLLRLPNDKGHQALADALTRYVTRLRR